MDYMIQYLLWGISFFMLWLSIVWLNCLMEEKPKQKLTRLPTLSIIIPCYNRAKTLEKTIKSIFNADYPKKLLDVIIVDDCSKDNSVQVAEKLQKKYPIRLIKHTINKGAGGALNTGLWKAKGELFARIDSDSRIEPDSIKKALEYMTPAHGAVIPRVIVDEPKTLVEKLQRFEYNMSALTRKIMSNFGTLSINGGVLPIYKTTVLRKLGGFDDKNNLTEDLEMALRLKANGYKIEMAHESITYTKAPTTVHALWRQRIRWCRGYITNHWKYRHLMFSKKHGIFGIWQMPVNVVIVALLIINVLIVSYGSIHDGYIFVSRSLTINDYFLTRITDLPTIKEFVLARNFQIIIPIILGYIVGIYLVYKAHKFFKERMWGQLRHIVLYFLLVPYFTAANWTVSIVHEMFRTKRKW